MYYLMRFLIDFCMSRVLSDLISVKSEPRFLILFLYFSLFACLADLKLNEFCNVCTFRVMIIVLLFLKF